MILACVVGLKSDFMCYSGNWFNQMQEKKLQSVAELPLPQEPELPIGYKPKRLRPSKTLKRADCKNCGKELPEQRHSRGRNREFCSESCRVIYHRVEKKASSIIARNSSSVESQLKDFEKYGFQKKTMGKLREIAERFPPDRALGHSREGAAQLAFEAVYREVIVLVKEVINREEKLKKLETKLAEYEREIKQLKDEKGVAT